MQALNMSFFIFNVSKLLTCEFTRGSKSVKREWLIFSVENWSVQGENLFVFDITAVLKIGSVKMKSVYFNLINSMVTFNFCLWFQSHTDHAGIDCSMLLVIVSFSKKKAVGFYGRVIAERGRDGTVARALAFHQCGLGLIPCIDAKCGSSLLLFLVPARRVVLQFFSLH